MPDSSLAPPRAYLDRWWTPPGAPVSVMVSSPADVTVHSRSLPGPVGDVDAADQAQEVVLGSAAGFPRSQRSGSYVRVPASPRFELSELSIQAWIYPTPQHGRLQGIVTHWRDGHGFGLFLGEQGDLVVGIGGDDASMLIGTERRLEPQMWHFIAASLTRSGEVVVMQRPIRRWPGDSALVRESGCSVRPATVSGTDLLLGAFSASAGGDERVLGHLDAKLDRPKLFGRALSRRELDALGDPAAGKVSWHSTDANPEASPDTATGADTARASAAPIGAAVVAAWDFGRDFATDHVTDASPQGLHGRLCGMAVRATTGFNWRGGTMDYAKAAHEYGAVQFRSDHGIDQGWPPALRFEVSAPGAYTIVVRSEAGATELPLLVSGGAARVAVWLPTFTYDLHRAFSSGEEAQEALVVPALRPASGPLSADAPLLRDVTMLNWLAREGVAYSLTCDHQVHRDGTAAFENAHVVLTGGEPAFASRQTLDALEHHVQGGGALMYLGGGYRFVCSPHEQDGGGLECRLDAAPGEHHHAATGELGGTWRRRGRPAEAALGVGYAGSTDQPASYRRTPASHEPRFAPLFADVGEQSIGGWGAPPTAVLVDRADASTTPQSATLLARAAVASSSKREAAVAACADLVWLDYVGGGVVFSVGSSAWSTQLRDRGSDVSRVTRRVLDMLLGSRD